MNEKEILENLGRNIINVFGEKSGYLCSWYVSQLKSLQNLYEIAKETYSAPVNELVKDVSKILDEIGIDHHKDLKWIDSNQYVEGSWDVLECFLNRIHNLMEDEKWKNSI